MARVLTLLSCHLQQVHSRSKLAVRRYLYKCSDTSGFSIFPALTSGTLRFSKAAQGLKNIQNATCYVNAVLQAFVHLPYLASVPIAEWKNRGRCSQNGTCWLCYLGLRVAASRGDGCEDQAPSWVLKRLHLLLPTSSTAKRHKSTPDNPDEASLGSTQSISANDHQF